MRTLIRTGARTTFVAALMLSIQACGCDDDPIAPATGSIEVSTVTTGGGTDPDGYTVSVDGGTGVSVAANGSVVIPGLSEGNHSVSLTGVDAACTVTSGEPLTVAVVARTTVQAAFEVTCTPSTATVIVTTVTTGDTIDPDGYMVAVDSDTTAIGVNDSVTFADFAVGDAGIVVGVSLLDVAANCSVADSATRTASLAGGDTARVDFAVTCVAPSAGGGTVVVTTATTGQSIDPNGYFAKIGADSMAIGVNDTVVFTGLPDGTNTVLLTGVATNCTLAGTASRSVTITNSDSMSVAYQVTCQPPMVGSVKVVTVTTGDTLDADGYRARIVSDSMAIGINDSVTFSNVSVGTRSVILTGIAANCAVADSARRRAVVTTGTTTRVSFPVTCQATAPTVKDWITFTSNRDGNDEIYLIRPDGTGAVNLTMNAAADQDAAWAPDSTRIAFRSTRDGDGEIFVMNSDGTGLVQITNNSADEASPAWSPDGTRLAFVSNRDGNEEIYVANADGSGAVNITNSAATDEDPAWSRDGLRIAFTTNRDGNEEIYSMATDGTGLVNLTNNPANDSWPAWSRDGTRIAFGTDRDGNVEVYVMAADGTGPTNLTNNPAADAIPTWSPDGTRIAFRTSRDGNNEIYSMAADGSSVMRITNNPANDRHPSWGRTAR